MFNVSSEELDGLWLLIHFPSDSDFVFVPCFRGFEYKLKFKSQLGGRCINIRVDWKLKNGGAKPDRSVRCLF